MDEEPLPRLAHHELGEPAKVYRYVDAHGALLFVVCRFEPKTFRQAHLEAGRWVWNLKDVERVPYRLPRVLEALAKGERIYIAEGEKDVDAIEQTGAAGTCNPMGAGKFTDEIAEHLQGARYVTVVVDRDDEDKRDTPENRIKLDRSPTIPRCTYLTPGEAHALAIRDQLIKLAGVASTDIELVQAAQGKDPFDHLAAGQTLAELVPWIPPVIPPDPPKPAAANAAAPAKGWLLTDYGNAERLVHEHGQDLRYVPQIGWHAWDGHRWVTDSDGEAERRAKVTVRRIAKDGFALEGEARDRQLKHAIKSEGAPRLEAMVKLARTERPVVAPVSSLDANRYALNVRNGTVDLTTGTIAAHDRADLITKLAPVDHQPGATCPTWERFLETIFAGDTDLVSFVQKAVGYSLTGSTEEQVLFLLHGRGENGKSTFVDTLQELLGDYAQQAPTEMLMAQTRARGGATPDLARLPGARFVSAVETGEGRRIDEPLVKQLTGGDRITARRLYREPFEFTPTHKLWLATNHLPQIAGTDHAIWRRVRLIPFTVTISAEQKDLQLKQKLVAEGPGILRWAIDGCAAWQVEGLEPPTSVVQATQAYRDDMDELGAFLDECVEIADTFERSVKASILFTRYEYWAKAEGAQAISATAFGRALTERGFHKTKQRDGWHYTGIGLPDQQGELN